jgi:hypothetical protein
MSLKLFAEFPGSALVSSASDSVPAITNFAVHRSSPKIVATRRRNQHSRRVRYPDVVVPHQEELS